MILPEPHERPTHALENENTGLLTMEPDDIIARFRMGIRKHNQRISRK